MHWKVAVDQGLSQAEVRRRRDLHGPNRLREVNRRSAWRILGDQFQSLIVLLLAVAATLSYAFGEWLEGTAIVAVILLNAAIGFFTELRAVRSMEALHQLTRVSARVRRDGQAQEIPADELVPGDLVLLDSGDLVSADLRLLEAAGLQVDESALTGESVPVGKQVEAVAEEAPLAERASMLYSGTAVTRGTAAAVVVATGMKTELGRISALTQEAEEERTPLEKRLDQLGHWLVWLTLGLAVLVALTGILAGKGWLLMLKTSIALAVAAIPEGLPIVATIALARGMWRMARRQALINRLSAVETLGATTLICTDKTGTLTENQMTVTRLALPSGEVEVGTDGPIDDRLDEDLRQALEIGVLCGNAEPREPGADGKQWLGDPMEVALLVVAARAGIRRDDLRQRLPEVREEAFDPDVKMMATYHEEDDHLRVAVKGAPEAVLEVCSSIRIRGEVQELQDQERERWLERSQRLAEKGLRILALATKTAADAGAAPYEGLTFLALVGLLDPPRRDVRRAIEECQQAGIRVVMLTGDQAATALNVGQAVGLVPSPAPHGGDTAGGVVHGKELEPPEEMTEAERQRVLRATILARVNPRQKLDLVTLYQQSGEVVAMTGDGVNDAPALKKADIGIAMGRRGTQVAREAADMVLKDDAFSTIVVAVAEGRGIFTNIRKFVVYLLSCNISEILVVALASLAGAPLPILPLQILFLNLVTDVFPALALGVGEGDPSRMKRPPRPPREPVLNRRNWLAVGFYGLLITLATLSAFGLAFAWLDMTPAQAVSVAFLTLGFAQLWHVFNLRDSGSRLLHNDVVRNPYLWAALALCTLLLFAAVYVPGLGTVLQVVDPGFPGWALVIGMSLIPVLVGQVVITLYPRLRHRDAPALLENR
jgi:Ca2+-transporting ATPase